MRGALSRAINQVGDHASVATSPWLAEDSTDAKTSDLADPGAPTGGDQLRRLSAGAWRIACHVALSTHRAEVIGQSWQGDIGMVCCLIQPDVNF